MMQRSWHLVFTLLLVTSPMPALAECAGFLGYNADGNWHDDIEARVDSALSCESWPKGFDQSSLNHAEGFVVQGLLSKQKSHEALAKAREFFEDAVRRYKVSARDPNHTNILTPEGKLHSRMGSNLYQTGMLLADAESVSKNCRDIGIIHTLVSYVQDDVRKRAERSVKRAEAAGRNLEQLLLDTSLEELQKHYPEATSKDDVRRFLKLEQKTAVYRNIDSKFLSLFTTTMRVDSGKAEKCLADAFIVYPEIASMGAKEREANFPRSSGYISRNLVKK